MLLGDNLQEAKWSIIAADLPTRVLSANIAEQAPPVYNASLASIIQKYVPYSEGDKINHGGSQVSSSSSAEESKSS